MDLVQAKTTFYSTLRPLYTEEELRSLFVIVCERTFNMDRVEVALNPEALIDDAQKMAFESVLKDLSHSKPIQYIYGVAHFYHSDFKVEPGVLIPRPETEELVDIIIKETRIPNPRLLDIGTGSGCIAVSLGKYIPQAQVTALDISDKALSVAMANARTHQVAIALIKDNVLTLEELPDTYDIIVSNPPYVRNLEKEHMQTNVLDYEPSLALFVEDTNPLVFYEKIAVLAIKALSSQGVLYFEINQYLGQETKTLVENTGFTDVRLIKDFKGCDRFIAARR
ncbi:MAG: protein-(glutamine-N5) methyltransferase, release factor-specific [Flavobacteriia bacterium]|nr:MAG: protein-(glutamine-N5) methyltransferase, release factor-specific [Flavobacteriia bacterium]